MATGRISEKSLRVLRRIAFGQSYKQIVDSEPDITYFDIFRAAEEAVKAVSAGSGYLSAPQGAPTAKQNAAQPAYDASVRGSNDAVNPRPVRLANQDRYEAIRAQFPRAYQSWSQTEEDKLLTMYRRGLDIRTIAAQLQRQPSAIWSRLLRLSEIDPGR